MLKAILGTKVGMTQVFTQDGIMVPVTVVKAGPCVIVQKKTAQIDGYNSLQLGFGEIKAKKVNKPESGHFKKAGVEVARYLREIRVETQDSEVGQVIRADIFEAGEMVDVSGTSHGKGFAGVIKRHGQHRGPMAHGSRYHRRPGSMGACSTPSKVFKGKNLPGRMGGETVTIQNLQIVRVDLDRDVILVKGAIPGAKGGLVTISNSVKKA
jgi:large subunit ribosomal protein L3